MSAVEYLNNKKNYAVEKAPSKSQVNIAPPKKGFWEIAKNYAGIIDSRESITRLFLDLSAFDIPVVIAGATRNWKSFLEACLEAGWSTCALFFAPFLTKSLAKITAKLYLEGDEKNQAENISKFYREELQDEESFNLGKKRLIEEEKKDLERIGKLYETLGYSAKAEKYRAKIEPMQNFYKELEYSPQLIQRYNKLKETIIVGQSAVEGFLWGGFGLALRWFRKNVLGEERFTGTKKYLNDKDSKKLGEAEELGPLQKILGKSALGLAPVLNMMWMKLTRNPENIANNKFLQMVKSGMDMTHGLFPKLGLLFSYTTVPKWFGAFCTTQGVDELIERVIKFCTLIPSWWLGHRVANGNIAKYLDKKLAEKFGVERGILLEENQLSSMTPEAAKIHHVLEKTAHNPELQAEAQNAHAITLYLGMALHSIGVLGVTLLANQITKWRVEAKKKIAGVG
ncbi:MAG: hypothetical protein RLZZ361_388 [Cyanobacteriota bacterium]|jgi:hypothetical protein